MRLDEVDKDQCDVNMCVAVAELLRGDSTHESGHVGVWNVVLYIHTPMVLQVWQQPWVPTLCSPGPSPRHINGCGYPLPVSHHHIATNASTGRCSGLASLMTNAQWFWGGGQAVTM